uniref:Uncharacterized protein n=1 Tax=Sphaerodactylus townsendi TaxID=933632 RepID=A0ACB8FZF0_9SAUR
MWCLFRSQEAAWESEQIEYQRALTQMNQDMENLCLEVGCTRIELHRAQEEAWMAQLQQVLLATCRMGSSSTHRPQFQMKVAKERLVVDSQRMEFLGKQSMVLVNREMGLQVANWYNQHPQEGRDSRFVRSSPLRQRIQPSGRCLPSEAASEDPHLFKERHFNQGPQSKEEHSSACSAHRAGLQFFR